MLVSMRVKFSVSVLETMLIYRSRQYLSQRSDISDVNLAENSHSAVFRISNKFLTGHLSLQVEQVFPSNLKELGSTRMTWLTGTARFEDRVVLNQKLLTKAVNQGSSPFGGVSLIQFQRQITWK